jgi:transcriptional regulator with XRE-family HTH domain
MIHNMPGAEKVRSGEARTANTPAEVFARRLQETRKTKGWSQQKLVEQLTRLGYRMDRATLAQIESGARRSDVTRSDNVTLNEVVALSVALGVALIHMVVPPESDDAPVRLVPNRVADPALTARRWARGEQALGDEGFYWTQVPAREQLAKWTPLKGLQEGVAALVARFPTLPGKDDEEAAHGIQEMRSMLNVIDSYVKAMSNQLGTKERRLIREGLLVSVAEPTVPSTTPRSTGTTPDDRWRDLEQAAARPSLGRQSKPSTTEKERGAR